MLCNKQHKKALVINLKMKKMKSYVNENIAEYQSE